MTRLAASLMAITLLSGCGFTRAAERSLEAVGVSVAKLKGDADRNREGRMALARHVAELELARTLSDVGAQTGGVVSIGFAQDLITTALEIERGIALTDAAERANIEGNAGNAAGLLGIVIEGSVSTRAAIEATGPAIEAALERGMAARQRLRAARAIADKAAAEAAEEE